MSIWLAIPGLLLTFYLLKIVSDEVENSFSALAFKYKIPATIAGATLLAVGGSAGELFTALNSAIFYKTFEIGIVTIIWSAIFNLFVITGLVGIKSKKPIPLAQKGMIRDMLFYFIAALSLAVSIFDGKISRTESLFFLGIYAIYLFVLYNGNLQSDRSSSGFYITKTSTGVYKVTLSGLGSSDDKYIAQANPEYSNNPVIANVDYVDFGGSSHANQFYVRTFNMSGTPVNNSFHFVVYKK